MKIQKILSLCLAIALTLAFTQIAQAQSTTKNGKPAKEKQEIKLEKAQEDGKEKADTHRKPLKPTKEEQAQAEKNKEKAKAKGQKANAQKDNKGKAYGKDKGGKSGREFGQHRADEARSKEKPAKREKSRQETPKGRR